MVRPWATGRPTSDLTPIADSNLLKLFVSEVPEPVILVLRDWHTLNREFESKNRAVQRYKSQLSFPMISQKRTILTIAFVKTFKRDYVEWMDRRNHPRDAAARQRIQALQRGLSSQRAEDDVASGPGTLLPDFQHHVRWCLGGSTDVRETRLVQYLSEPLLTGLCT